MHPKTGKVCIPLDASAAADFDPEDVPTVQELMKSINPSKASGEVCQLPVAKLVPAL